MPRDVPVLGQLRVALLATPENKRVVVLELEYFSLNRPGNHLQNDFGRHGNPPNYQPFISNCHNGRTHFTTSTAGSILTGTSEFRTFRGFSL